MLFMSNDNPFNDPVAPLQLMSLGKHIYRERFPQGLLILAADTR